MKVVGLDACPGGWVGVLLVDGHFVSIEVVPDLATYLRQSVGLSAIGIDIPIGLPEEGIRLADVKAKEFVGRRRASVFMTPPRRALECPDYSEASEICRALAGYGLSRQSYGLREKVLLVDGLVSSFVDLFEVHPEVSFTAMHGEPMKYRKKSWNGHFERLKALSLVGIHLPVDGFINSKAGVDDVVDAAAASWTAHRKATGTAATLPADPVGNEGRPVAIWY